MVIATGFFDGVHIGHRHVIEQLVQAARERGDRSMVITFWPHPRTVLQDGARTLRLLTSLEEKKKMLLSLGVDEVEVIHFTKEFSRLTTKEYLKQYIIGKYGGKALLLGYDNRLGSDSGTPEEIADIAGTLGLETIIVNQFPASDGVIVSSTKIRNLISAGEMEKASEMLGYEYQLYGVVVSGNRLGRTIGFPTANMQLYEPLKLLPDRGVYLVKVETVGKSLYGMCNIGYRPTVSSGLVLTIETHIFDFYEDIYGLDIRISFIKKIRGEQKFGDINILKMQLENDRESCLSFLERR